ncbi:hypothetical protein KHC28_00095 [Ancylobacter sonchi]|uniref:hypothetical protein n=1 Tax=Ancylobacter sonchi TaxID=1937790 RepID=UPI001BD42D56|nr:hypothetical protein [Ancylobacter sonchi]MBS7532065.1 hypothetical protein [Ancylobacter sonchi]
MLTDPASPIHTTWRRRRRIDPDPSDAVIRECLIAAAELVDRHGEQLRPLLVFFESLYRNRTGRGTEAERIRALIESA